MKIAALMAALAAVFLIGCGGGAEEAAPTGESVESPAGAGATDSALTVVAESGDTNAFDSDHLEIAGGQTFALELKNPDAEPHNLSVYAAKGGENLFRGAFVDPGKDMTYDVPALPNGELYFQCDVHPEMFGTLTVSA